MWLKHGLVVAVAVCAAVLGSAGAVHAAGLVQNAGKNAAKGALKGAMEEVNTGNVTHGAKEITEGVLDGAANAAPLLTSQIVNQANVNKKTIGKVAREVTSDAVVGAVGASVSEMEHALGPHGDGPLADTLAATTERMAAAFVRGARSQIYVTPPNTIESEMEGITAAMVRGATEGAHFHFSIWPLVLAFIVGCISTLLCGLGLTFLYLLFQRKREPVVEVKQQHPSLRPQPIMR